VRRTRWKSEPPCNKVPCDSSYKGSSNDGEINNIRIYDSFTDSCGNLKGKIRKATKLKNAAMLTAATGERTFVETIVAIEFAES
jgi:hypothetical protein